MKTSVQKVEIANLRRLRAVHAAKTFLAAVEATLENDPPSFDTLHTLDAFSESAKELRAAISDEFLQRSLLADLVRKA